VVKVERKAPERILLLLFFSSTTQMAFESKPHEKSPVPSSVSLHSQALEGMSG